MTDGKTTEEKIPEEVGETLDDIADRQRPEYYKYFFNHVDKNVFVKHYVIDANAKSKRKGRAPYILEGDEDGKPEHIMDYQVGKVYGCGKCYCLILEEDNWDLAVEEMKVYLCSQVLRYQKGLKGAMKRYDLFRYLTEVAR